MNKCKIMVNMVVCEFSMSVFFSLLIRIYEASYKCSFVLHCMSYMKTYDTIDFIDAMFFAMSNIGGHQTNNSSKSDNIYNEK